MADEIVEWWQGRLYIDIFSEMFLINIDVRSSLTTRPSLQRSIWQNFTKDFPAKSRTRFSNWKLYKKNTHQWQLSSCTNAILHYDVISAPSLEYTHRGLQSQEYKARTTEKIVRREKKKICRRKKVGRDGVSIQ